MKYLKKTPVDGAKAIDNFVRYDNIFSLERVEGGIIIKDECEQCCATEFGTKSAIELFEEVIAWLKEK